MGDRIRFVALPSGFSRDNCDQETLDAYEFLIACKRAVRVQKLDDLQMPWIGFRRRDADGGWVHEYLLINHDGWVKVIPRQKK